MVKIEINDNTTIFTQNICAINIFKSPCFDNKMKIEYYANFNMSDGKSYRTHGFDTKEDLDKWLENVLD